MSAKFRVIRIYRPIYRPVNLGPCRNFDSDKKGPHYFKPASIYPLPANHFLNIYQNNPNKLPLINFLLRFVDFLLGFFDSPRCPRSHLRLNRALPSLVSRSSSRLSSSTGKVFSLPLSHFSLAWSIARVSHSLSRIISIYQLSSLGLSHAPLYFSTRSLSLSLSPTAPSLWVRLFPLSISPPPLSH